MSDGRDDVSEDPHRERALVDFLRLDYDATLRAMSSILTVGGQIRAIGIAAWAVALGLAVRGDSVELAALALGIVLVFVYADAYHAALYRRVLQRAIHLESLIDTWINRLGIDSDDPEAITKARAKLEMNRFGIHRSLRRPSLIEMLKARPRPVFWVIYPALLAASIVALVVYACP